MKNKWSYKYLMCIDIQLWLHPVDTRKLVGRKKGEPSSAIAKRIIKAREIQKERFRDEGIFTNAEMGGRLIERFCPLDKESEDLVEKIIDKLGLSARAFTRILKVARTIADLEGEERIRPEFLSEAASYRFLDRINDL